MSPKFLVAVAALSLPAVGCEPSSTERLSETQEAVAYGQPSGPSDDGVVFLESLANNGRIWRCTGTLVAPNLVLTARHCVASFQTGYWSCDSQGNLVGSTNGAGQMGVLDDPSNIYVVGGSSVRIGPRVTPAAKGLSIFAAQTSTVCINDLALVVLDTQLTNLPYLPLRLYSGAQPVRMFE